MKTSVTEVHDMLSVLSVVGVEKRIGAVAGVESVTVNHAAGNATVRYDETRLDIADIKSDVRQSGYESDATAAASTSDAHEGYTAPNTPKTPPVTPPATLAPAAAKSAPADTAPADNKPKDKAAADTAPSTPASTKPTATEGNGHEGHMAMDKKQDDTGSDKEGDTTSKTKALSS